MFYWNGTTMVTIAPGTTGQTLTYCSGVPTLGPCPVHIGDSYQGGIVFYILQSSDPGYDANLQHGFIAATADQCQNTGIQWSNGSSVWTSTENTALGTGSANTTAIINIQGVGNYAASICRNYNGGGYNDWFLPSKDELYKLYLNQGVVGGFNGNNTGVLPRPANSSFGFSTSP